MLKERIKENKYILLFIILVVILFVGKLFPINYPTDIYNIKLLGLKKYAYNWFLPSGRIIGLLVLYILDTFHVSVNAYISIMKIFSIIIAIISIFLFYDLLIQKKKPETKIKKIIYLLLTLIIFLNHGTYQYFYYPESGVMWLAILMVVLALRCMVLEKEKKYIKCWVYIFIAMNCYQAIIYLYLPALILFLSTYLKNPKEEWKEFLKNLIIVLSNLLIGYIIVKFSNDIFDVAAFHSTKIIFNFDIIKNETIHLLLNNVDTTPNLILLIGNAIILLCLIIIQKKNYIGSKKDTIIKCILVFIVAFGEVLCTISLLDFYNGDRIQFAYIASLPINMLLIILYTKLPNKKWLAYIITIILIIILGANLWNSYDLTKDSFIARKIDDERGKHFVNLVQKYEKEHNTKLEKVIYCYDDEYTRYDKDLRQSLESSAEIFGNWSTDGVLKYFLGENIQITYDQYIYDLYYENKNWDYYDDEQIIFNNNIMYICFY